MKKGEYINVVAAVFKRDGLVLVARRGPEEHLAGKWEFPGGKSEEGETPQACLQRELGEEFGVTVEVGDYLGESVFSYPEKNIRLIAYYVNWLAGEFCLTVHDRINWVAAGDLEAVELAEADIAIAQFLQQQEKTEYDGGRDFYERQFQSYSGSTFAIDSSVYLLPLTRFLPPGSSLLDIGCGSGRDLLWLKKRGYNPTGFERSTGLAELAGKNSGCPVIVADFTSYDFSALRFDALLLIGALVHLPYPDFIKALTDISSALDRGGKILLTVKEGQGVRWRGDGRVDFFWHPESLERIFGEFGFDILEFSRNNSAIRQGETWLGYLLAVKENQDIIITKRDER
jgi:mutator protein MutT